LPLPSPLPQAPSARAATSAVDAARMCRDLFKLIALLLCDQLDTRRRSARVDDNSVTGTLTLTSPEGQVGRIDRDQLVTSLPRHPRAGRSRAPPAARTLVRRNS